MANDGFYGGSQNEVLLSDGQGGFASTLLQRNDNSYGAVSGDWDGDGLQDVFVANSVYATHTVGFSITMAPETVYVGSQNELLTSDGQGGFTSTLLQRADLSYGGTSGDWNGDGLTDLYVANQNRVETTYNAYGYIDESKTIDGWNEVLLSDGQGGFAATLLPRTDNSMAAASGDWNGDGTTDVFVVNQLSENEVLLRDGQGGFTSTLLPRTDDSRGATAGDWNDDGLTDLFVCNFGQNEVLLSDGQGGFTSTLLQRTDSSNEATSGDWNGDGLDDIFVVNGVADQVYGAGGTSNEVLLGDGQGGFTSTLMSRLDVSYGVTSGDWNGDGLTDLFVEEVLFMTLVGSFRGTDGESFTDTSGHDIDSSSKVLLSDGHGGFISTLLGSGSIAATSGDWNGDGLIDLFLATYGELQRDGAWWNMYTIPVSTHTYELLLGDGQGGFTSTLLPRTDDLVGGWMSPRSDRISLVSGDLNGDRLLNVYVAKPLAQNEVLLGDGQGGFTIMLLPHTDDSVGATSADWNGDGMMDVFVANFDSENEQGGFDLCAGHDGYAPRPGVDPGCYACPRHTTDTISLTRRCELCPAGTIAPGPGIRHDQRFFCIPCEVGTARNLTELQCTTIPAGKYAGSGFERCESCVIGQVTSNAGVGSTGCSSCQPGLGPNADRTQCISCTGTTFSTIGQCQDCAAPNMVDDAHQTCSACSQTCSACSNRTTCLSCTGTTYSSFGVECTLCDAPSVVNPARTACSSCTAGLGPNVNRTQCISCTGTTFSTIGQCQDCAAPNIVDDAHQTCSACSPGEEPNANRTTCLSCTGTTYSSFGVECTACDAPSVVNPARTACSSCTAGLGPNVNRTQCISCTGTTFSTIGQCQDCAAPNIVDDAHQTCSACSPGEEPNANHTICLICRGNAVALVGFCIPCGAGKTANKDKTECADMNQSPQPVTDLAMVDDIVADNSSNVLVETSVMANASSFASPDAFQLTFKRDMVAALDIDEAHFEITAIHTGARARRRRLQGNNETLVVFTIDSPHIIDILHDLAEQLEDPNSSLRNSPAGAVVANRPPTFAFVCPAGMMRTTGAGQWSVCLGIEIPTADQTGCRACLAGTSPSDDLTQCVCEEGLYNVKDLPVIQQCFEFGWVNCSIPEPSATTGCYTCPTVPSCLECSVDIVTLRAGYRFATDDAPLAQNRHAFRCPIESACPAHVLVAQLTLQRSASSNDRRLIVQNCSAGHGGLLCTKCLSGWKMSFAGVCEPCSTSKGWLNPLLLVPVAFACAYMIMRKL